MSQLGPQRRPQSVGGNQRDAAFVDRSVARARMDGHPVGVDGKILDLGAEPQQRVRALAHGFAEHCLQIGAVDHPIRRAEAQLGGRAERNAHDLAAALPIHDADRFRPRH